MVGHSVVLEIGGQPTEGKSREEVEEMVSQAARPVTLRFAFATDMSSAQIERLCGKPKSGAEVLGQKKVECSCQCSVL